MSKIDAFIQQLSQTDAPPHSVNPYTGKVANGYNADRRHNLRRFLRELHRRRPTLMLIAEAPGYRGCRLSGIPFVSPAILRDGLPDFDLFGPARGYRPIDEWPHVRREASATIMWETLGKLDLLPVLWNAFPFHPHRPDEPQSNRAPKVSELRVGRPFLIMLQDLFPRADIIAVGNKARLALTRWHIDHVHVRHPSHGGKSDFVAGLKQYAAQINTNPA